MLFNIFAVLALALSISASPLVVRQVESSGNDGAGNQEVGNNGQNSGNGAANKSKIGGDYTVEQGVQTCGNAQLNCCNKIEKMGDTTNAGLLGAVFGSGDLGVQCTPLNVPVLIAGTDISPSLLYPKDTDASLFVISPGSYQQSLRCKGCLLSRRHNSGMYNGFNFTCYPF